MTKERHVRLNIEDPDLKAAMEAISDAVHSAGGTALIVGGSVRDAVLGRPIGELDIEVYGLTPDRLREVLTEHFEIDLVGEAFGVIRVRGVPIDVGIPRRESKAGLGHRGFEILSDPGMSFDEAATRRDFTINAAALDPMSGEVIDPLNGLGDLDNRILRHVSPKFAEDPLRVLRGMQLAARFELDVADETIALCRTIEPEGLAEERIFEEWRKLVIRGVCPSLGLEFLRETGWTRYFPELDALIGCEQDPGWHPEGDVWTHTLHSMDAFAMERIGDEWEDLVVGFAVLCHDFGKPATSLYADGRIRSHRHEGAGKEPTHTFLRRLTRQKDLIEQVVPLVVDHLRPQQLLDSEAGDSTIRRLARRVRRIDRLVRVARADHLGRPGVPSDGFPAGDWLLKRAEELAIADAAPTPVVMGRHLIDLGLEPGPHFGRMLDACYEAQLDGEFATLEEGLEYARRLMKKESA